MARRRVEQQLDAVPEARVERQLEVLRVDARHGVGDDLLHGGLELGQDDLRLDQQAAEHLFARVARDRARLS